MTLAIGMLLIVGCAGEGVAEVGALEMAVADAPVRCTAEQTAGVIPSFGLHALMDVQVSGPGVVTEITFELEETTDPADVTGLSVYYTGSGTEFRPLRSFGSAVPPFSGRLTVEGTQQVGVGLHHFWIAVEPSRHAVWGRKLDVRLLDVRIDGVRCIPGQGAPPESLTLGNGIFSTVVRRSGDDGVNTYRIPGIATT
ncbi:MAG: BNR-repeat neuraminidase N-terminal domain-containing protein, partial [Verrucomicrobiota bacterium]|nr:BNR-repeat neuraminidase N-terminal domain-containing protein [Verrucomicrobiota bacterium]